MQKFQISLSKIILPFILLVPLVSPTTIAAQDEQSTPKLKDVFSETEPSEDSTQDTSTVKAEQKKLVKAGPDDDFDRGVPRTSVAGFFKAAKNNNWEIAAQYLDLRNLPRGYSTQDGPELARQLKVVLDRSLWVDMDLLSMDPEGHSDDGLPSYRDLLGQIEVKNRHYDILLQRVPRGDGIRIWKISSKTIRDIPKLYSELGYGPIGEKLSTYFPEYELLGLLVWQWISLFLIILAAALVSFPVIRIISWLIKRRKTDLSLLVARFLNGPVYLIIILVITRQNFELIHPSLTARAIFEGATIFIIAMTWLLIRLVNLFGQFYSQRLQQHDQDHVVVLLRPALTALNIMIIFIGLVIWLDNIGFSVTTVVAGLGIGGIAIALATQKSIENFIGAVTLYLAAPVKVGDFCRFGDKMGGVEEIGLRATKIRTLENTVLSIPNAEFAATQLENFTERLRFRFSPMIRLRIETTATQLRYVLRELKKLLYAYCIVADSPLRVRFVGFGEYSLDIEIHSYIATTDIDIFKAVSEDLYFRIMDIVSSAGTSIAIPAAIEHQTTLKVDPDAQNKFEKQIQNLDSKEISVELSEQEIDEIINTIPYPTEAR
jgi:MscS family membrane protein